MRPVRGGRVETEGFLELTGRSVRIVSDLKFQGETVLKSKVERDGGKCPMSSGLCIQTRIQTPTYTTHTYVDTHLCVCVCVALARW